jgi:ABC-type multidrug transport system fused ATPase/permease subunit
LSWPAPRLAVIVENIARLGIPLAGRSAASIMRFRRCWPRIDRANSWPWWPASVGWSALQAVTGMVFLTTRAGSASRCCWTLRRRLFRHFGRLDIAFHDRYTSGGSSAGRPATSRRSRRCSETGFDSLITAVLTLAGTAVLLVVLDVRLGLMCLAATAVLVALLRWFARESSAVYRRVRGEFGPGDRAVRRNDDRDQGGAGLPAGAPQPGDLRRGDRPLPQRQRVVFPTPGHLHAFGQTRAAT